MLHIIWKKIEGIHLWRWRKVEEQGGLSKELKEFFFHFYCTYQRIIWLFCFVVRKLYVKEMLLLFLFIIFFGKVGFDDSLLIRRWKTNKEIILCSFFYFLFIHSLFETGKVSLEMLEVKLIINISIFYKKDRNI